MVDSRQTSAAAADVKPLPVHNQDRAMGDALGSHPEHQVLRQG